MPRNMSFMLTTDQIQRQQKTVTRRSGWEFLQLGDIVNACEKCMGLKPGEKIRKICQIKIISVTREPLDHLLTHPDGGDLEATKEGFPDLTGRQFVDFFLAKMGGHSNQLITRIEFCYLKPAREQSYLTCKLCGAGFDNELSAMTHWAKHQLNSSEKNASSDTTR